MRHAKFFAFASSILLSSLTNCSTEDDVIRPTPPASSLLFNQDELSSFGGSETELEQNSALHRTPTEVS